MFNLKEEGKRKMKSNLSEHMNPVDFEIVRQQEMDEILEWLDEDTDSYVRFLAWKQVRDAYRQAQDEWARSQDETQDPEY